MLMLMPAYGMSAAAQIDQSYVPEMINGVGNILGFRVESAQTFTVGASGVLTGFDIWVTRQQNIQQPLLFDIRRTQGGVPVDANAGPDIRVRGALPAASIAISRPLDPPPSTTSHLGSPAIIDLYSPHLAPEALVHVALSSFDILVTQGEVLAIVLGTEDPNDLYGLGYVWHGKSPGEYAGGSLYFRSNADNTWHTLDPFGSLAMDQAFRTYVQAVPEPTADVVLILAGIFALSRSARTARPGSPTWN